MDKQIKKVEKEKERIEYIDNARGMLILLVVLGHVLLFTGAFEIVPYSFIMKMIYAFHMPAFLIISGILFDFDKWKKQSIFIFIKSRFIRFIVPYFIFEIIGALFHLIFNWGQIDSFKTSIIRILTINTYVGADWYLVTCFFSEILVFLLLKYSNKIFNYIIIIATIIYTSFFEKIICFKINGSVLRILICASIILFAYYNKIWFMKTKKRKFVFASAIVFLICSLSNILVFLHIPRIGNPLMFTLSAIAGTHLILGIAQSSHSWFLNYLGNNTMPILGTHQNIELVIAYYFGGQPNGMFIGVSFIIMVTAELIIIPIYNKGKNICQNIKRGIMI